MPLCTFDHIAHTRTLMCGGWNRAALAAAVASGDIRRLRRGLYACPHADPEETHAALLGGQLTCVSILRRHGVWSGRDQRVHVQLHTHSSMRDEHPGRYRIHYRVPRFTSASTFVAGRSQALWEAIHCLDEENALAAIESAIQSGFLPYNEVMKVVAYAPRRLEWGLRRLVVDSGSGNETIVRLRLLRAGYPVVAQGRVPGLGRQDLVVDDCIGLEIDSKRWHDNERIPEDDTRDLQSEGLGRHVLRLSPRHIHESWPHSLAVIERVLSDARQARDARRGRAIDL